MKKIISLVVIGAMLLISFTSCGGGGGESESLTFKIAHVEAEDSSIHKSFVKFKENVEKESDGSITVEIYPNGELGGDVEVLESINLGNIQMSAMSSAVMTSYDERFSILDLPFLFDTQENMEKAVNGDLGKMYLGWMEEYGFKGLGFQYDGARCVSNNKRAINKVEDMNGLKIRVMESPIYIDMFKRMGANPTPMSFDEVYTALQQGVVDGQDNAPGITYNSKFYEVQKYYSLTKHTYANCPIITNKSFIEGLPEDQSKIILDAAQEYLIKWQRNEATSLDSDYIQKMTDDSGTKVNELTPENQKGFVESVQPIYTDYEKKLGKEVLDEVKDLAN